MNRRQFVKRLVPVTALPFMIQGFPLKAYGRSPFLELLTHAATATDRVLVLVQLGGGNDGINTVIPRDQYSTLMNVRSNIVIPESQVIPLTTSTGLHPAMDGHFTFNATTVGPNGGLKQLYDDAKLAIVQGVTYPNPNLSHFRATDIWLTASNYDEYLTTGWLGRYLGAEFPDYPNTPSSVMPDPLAIQIGSVVSLALQGSPGPMGISIQDPTSFYNLVNAGGSGGGTDTAPQTPAGRELTYVRQVAVESQEYAAQVKAAADQTARQFSTRSSLYPSQGQNSLADQLKIVATLIAGGLKTRIYIVNLGGFDNHSSQVVSGATATGIHAVLLGRLANALMAFQDDIRLMGLEDRMVGMTFSEFGRRVNSNNSLGTDHGTAAPMFLFGKPVQAGIVGVNPNLSDLVNGNLKMQVDFRSVYASVLSQWFGVDSTELSAVMLRDFQSLPLIRPVSTAANGNDRIPVDFKLYDNYPNPFNPSTMISYDLPFETNVQIKVYDMLGREVGTLVDDRQSAGRHQTQFNASIGLSSGAYIYRIEAGSFTDRRKMLLVR